MMRPDRGGSTDALERRVEETLAALTLEERVGQLVQAHDLDPDDPDDRAALRSGSVGSMIVASGATAGSIRDAGVRRERIDACKALALEAPHGIGLLAARDVIHGHRTVWPIPLGMAATWDESLAFDCAALAAREAAADGIDWTFAPMVDVVDDPRWGRVAESLGESPRLAERMGAALVRGFQSNGRTAATVKHFVGYGLARGGRDYAAASVGEITLRNVHLRPFRAAVDAGVLTVMASFTAVDGVPMHAHRRLLREVLKEEWGFDGVVVADWDGVGELVAHGVAADERDAVRLAIEAGIDVDMVSGLYARHLADLVRDGAVEASLVEDAARRVLRLKGRLGLLRGAVWEHDDGGGRHADVVEGRVDLDRGLARRAAVGSIAVVADDGALPVAASSRVLLAGPFVDEGAALLGTWVLDGDGDDVVAPSTALRTAIQESGGELVVHDMRFVDDLLRTARECDVAVAIVGEHPRRSGEDSVVSDLGLPAGQLEALQALAAVGTPLVVVVVTGRPLTLAPVLDVASTVLVVWHPGTEAGAAIADVLLGRSEATGRLPMGFPWSVGQVPLTAGEAPTGRPQDRHDRRASRYQDAPAAPRLPFAAGGADATVAYLPATASTGELRIAEDDAVVVRVEVENLGERACTELVRVHLRDLVADVTRPTSELLDWRRVRLEAGERRSVELTVRASDFGYVGRDLAWRIDPGEVELQVAPGRADGTRLGLRLR